MDKLLLMLHFYSKFEDFDSSFRFLPKDVGYNTNSSSVLSVAIEGSSGRILAIVGLVAQKCPLFPLLFCPNYTVQLFFSAFLSHAAV